MSSAMYAIAKSRLKSVSSWTTVDMDEVLQFGDKLYLDIAATVYASNYLQAKELPKRLSSCNTEFNVLQSDPMSGLLYSSSCQPPFVTIDAALQKALCSDDHHGCLVIVSVYVFAVMRSSLKKHYIYDSHCRNARGMACPNGTSVLLEVGSDVQHVLNHINQLARSLGLHLHRHCKFEVVPVRLIPFFPPLPLSTSATSQSASSSTIPPPSSPPPPPLSASATSQSASTRASTRMDKSKCFQDLFHAYRNAYEEKSAQVVQLEVNKIWIDIKTKDNFADVLKAKLQDLYAVARRKKTSLLSFWSKVSPTLYYEHFC